MLSRCIAIDPQIFAREYWGRRPLLSRSDALPRDFSDLLSADTVDELIAERGVRAPFIRLAKEGDVLARDCYLGSAGFGAEMPDQVDSAKVLSQFASGATIVLQGLHRLWPPLIDFVRHMVDDLGHPVQANAYITPPSSRGFDPHYDVHDVFVLQTSGHKHWIVHEPVHDRSARVAAMDRPSGRDRRSASAANRSSTPCSARVTRCICPADGCTRHAHRRPVDPSDHRSLGHRPVWTSFAPSSTSWRCRRVQEISAHGHRPDRPARNGRGGNEDHGRD